MICITCLFMEEKRDCLFGDPSIFELPLMGWNLFFPYIPVTRRVKFPTFNRIKFPTRYPSRRSSRLSGHRGKHPTARFRLDGPSAKAGSCSSGSGGMISIFSSSFLPRPHGSPMRHSSGNSLRCLDVLWMWHPCMDSTTVSVRE